MLDDQAAAMLPAYQQALFRWKMLSTYVVCFETNAERQSNHKDPSFVSQPRFPHARALDDGEYVAIWHAVFFTFYLAHVVDQDPVMVIDIGPIPGRHRRCTGPQRW